MDPKSRIPDMRTPKQDLPFLDTPIWAQRILPPRKVYFITLLKWKMTAPVLALEELRLLDLRPQGSPPVGASFSSGFIEDVDSVPDSMLHRLLSGMRFYCCGFSGLLLYYR